MPPLLAGLWRRLRPPRPIPPAVWQGVLARYPFLAQRPAAELERLGQLAAGFLADKEFHGTHGLVVSDEMAVAIAAQAVLPVLHLGLGWYDDFVGIVVHPGRVLARRRQTDEAGVEHAWSEVLAGEAMHQGPVMVNWDDVAAAGQTAEAGYNVVIHEFVHKLDMRDGVADGCPPLPSAAARRRWHTVLEPAYRQFREQVVIAERFDGPAPWLDAYGASAIDEFFAVACEAYFVAPARLAADFPALPPLFDSFFGPQGAP